MARSKESYNKREKEKQKIKQRQEKREKMEQRKAAGGKGKTLDDMIAYIDENGNISNTPPDPSLRKEVRAEDMQISVPKYEPGEEEETVRNGTVSYFDKSKGFGFITDAISGERVFVHMSELLQPISENDHVQFETTQGPRGLNAVNVRKA